MGDLLRQRAALQPDAVGYRFLLDGETEESVLTYGELDRRARAIAAHLQGSVNRGDRALLVYPPGLDYIAGFFGCLYAGVLAVPAYPPDPAMLYRTVPRVQAIAADAGAAVVLTTAAVCGLLALLAEHAPDLEALPWVATEVLPAGIEAGWTCPAVTPQSIAFLQYTSGSTGRPKGVMVSHANLLHNIGALIDCCARNEPGAPGVSWVPPYHDMGLIYGILLPLSLAFPSVLMSPIHFLERPLNWLRAIDRYRATISGATGFAFDLCVRRIAPEERARLDLRCWKWVAVGGEPMRAAVFDRFAQAFEVAGFDPATFGGGYGLAEATLMVSGPIDDTVQRPMLVRRLDREQLTHSGRAVDVARPPDDGCCWPAVACGRPLRDQETLVVDPTSRTVLSPRTVGEIWVAGPSVAAGYWNRPDETARTFGATLATGGGPFLRTGDLGFLDESGHLFIVGRCKDVIIVHGTNHYPDDIETTVARCHPALRPGCGAAVSVEIDDEERLVIIQEVRPGAADLAAIVREMRRAVAEVHGLQLHAVVLIEPGRLVKTSSGKVARQATREAFPLDAPERLRQQAGVRYVATRSRSGFRPNPNPTPPPIPAAPGGS